MKAAPWVLGFSASHNGSVCLLHGDEIVAAIQEERLNGIKRSVLGPLGRSLAFEYCLRAGGIGAHQLDAVVGCYFAGDTLDAGLLADGGWKGRFDWIPHHLGHAIGAFACSGLDEAALLIIDGQGGLERHQPPAERAVAKYAEANGLDDYREIMSVYRFDRDGWELLEKHYGAWLLRSDHADGMPRFASLGGMYSAVTQQLFGNPMDPGKVMGLSAYGSPDLPVEQFFTIAPDGHYVFNDVLTHRFHSPERWPARKAEYETLAASVQAAVEVGIMDMAARASSLSGCRALAYAGGVALNSVANEKLVRSGRFSDVFVMPAAEDSGPAIGAAFYGLRQLGYHAPPRRLRRDSVGRRFSADETAAAIAATPGVEVVPHGGELLDRVVDLLTDGKIIGWFQGGSELGPRALGQRSILADPRRADVKQTLNERVKHREPFRPFAPVILEEELARWFDVDGPDALTNFMLRAPAFRPEARARVPGAVHHDGTGRVQSVGRDGDPMYRELLVRFFARTGVPILINTSFNVMGEPIVDTPEDALWGLLYTELDFCVLGQTIVRRAPSFRSVLDLVPRVVAEELRISIRQGDGPLTLELDATSAAVSLVVRRPWGTSSLALPLSAVGAVEQMDGTRTGRQILEALGADAAQEWSARSFSRLLCILRRGGAIQLS
jgi:carbamoyltransferase